jgi:enoyl-[acyl-carrier protein] reductase II
VKSEEFIKNGNGQMEEYNMRSEVAELLGIKYPIIQGGMAWVAEHHLAAAVSNAGGFGIIGAANAPAEWVRDEIRKAKELTDKPFGVNVMLLSQHADEVAQAVAEEGVKAVTTGAGSPEKYMKMWREAGIRVIPVVASVALARRMERVGADALVAEGMESGGHIGAQTTMTLVPQIVDAVNIPVIAAGGIADGRGFAAARMLGADAVQMGTRFIVSRESIVHEAYKERVLKARDIDSEVTGMSTGHPVRCLRNQMTREYLKLEKEGASFEELELMTLGTLRKAVVEGDVTRGTVMAGQSAGLVKQEQTCSEMIEEIMDQAKKLLKEA